MMQALSPGAIRARRRIQPAVVDGPAAGQARQCALAVLAAACTNWSRTSAMHSHDILNDDERLAAGYELLQRFRRLIARRSVRDLIQWLLTKPALVPPKSSAAETRARTIPCLPADGDAGPRRSPQLSTQSRDLLAQLLP